MFTPGMQERRVGYIYEDERERIYADNKRLRAALEKIAGEVGTSTRAWKIAFEALTAAD